MGIILMDLDGVICDNSHRAHLAPHESKRHINEAWHPFVAACVDDQPIIAGVMMFLALRKVNPVVIVTSRQERFSAETSRWFDQVIGTGYNILYRPDDMALTPAEYKRWQLRKLVAEGFDIHFAIDDDPAVIAMYQSEGISTFQPGTICSSLTTGGI